jgi:hypothetical protein
LRDATPAGLYQAHDQFLGAHGPVKQCGYPGEGSVLRWDDEIVVAGPATVGARVSVVTVAESQAFTIAGTTQPRTGKQPVFFADAEAALLSSGADAPVTHDAAIADRAAALPGVHLRALAGMSRHEADPGAVQDAAGFGPLSHTSRCGSTSTNPGSWTSASAGTPNSRGASTTTASRTTFAECSASKPRTRAISTYTAKDPPCTASNGQISRPDEHRRRQCQWPAADPTVKAAPDRGRHRRPTAAQASAARLAYATVERTHTYAAAP